MHIYDQPITEEYLRHAALNNLKARHEYIAKKIEKLSSELTKVQHRIMVQSKSETKDGRE